MPTSIAASSSNDFFIAKSLRKGEVLPFKGSMNKEVRDEFSIVLGFLLNKLFNSSQEKLQGGGGFIFILNNSLPSSIT
jgi:hypothetical protein